MGCEVTASAQEPAVGAALVAALPLSRGARDGRPYEAFPNLSSSDGASAPPNSEIHRVPADKRAKLTQAHTRRYQERVFDRSEPPLDAETRRCRPTKV